MQFGKCLAACVLLAALTACEKKTSDVVTIMDTRVFPESITSTKSGDLIIGSLEKGAIYRAKAGEDKATLWLDPAKTEMVAVLGVYAHDASNTLYVCSMAPPAPEGQEREVKYAALRAFDLTTGEAKKAYPMPNAEKATCNDIDVDKDGSVFVTDTGNGKVLQLRPNSTELVEWIADEKLAGIDGLAIDDGVMYVNTVTTSRLFAIRMGMGSTPGEITELKPSMPINRPDGMRSIGGNKFIMAENAADVGRVTEVTVEGDQAKIRVLKVDPGVTAVTKVGDKIWVDNLKIAYRGNGPMKDKSPEPFTLYAIPAK